MTEEDAEAARKKAEEEAAKAAALKAALAKARETKRRSRLMKITYENGDKYEGMWIDGKLCGWGTMEYANGSTYEGLWFNDKRDTRIDKINAERERYSKARREREIEEHDKKQLKKNKSEDMFEENTRPYLAPYREREPDKDEEPVEGPEG